jgi:hypothetical protein
MPDIRDTHVDQLPTQLSIGFYNDPKEYIIQKIAPEVNVTNRSDIVPKYIMDEIMRDSAKERAPATESSGSDWDIDLSQHYFCRNFAHHKDVPWEAYGNTDEPFNVDRSTTRFVTDKILMKRESYSIGKLLGPGKWGKDVDMGVVAGGAAVPGISGIKWSDATSKPAKDVEAMRLYISGQVARSPGTLALGEIVYSTLKQHPDFIDRVKYTQTGIVTAQLMAAIFEVDRVLHSNSLVNVSKQGKVLQRMVGNELLFVYVTDAPALEEPSGAYMFNWKIPGISTPMYIRRFSMVPRMADRFEAMTYVDVAITMPEAGIYGFNVIV